MNWKILSLIVIFFIAIGVVLSWSETNQNSLNTLSSNCPNNQYATGATITTLACTQINYNQIEGTVSANYSAIQGFPNACNYGSYVTGVQAVISCLADKGLMNQFINTQGFTLGYYFPLDESAGSTIYDLSDNLNPATLQNSPVWLGQLNCVYGSCLQFTNTSSQYVNTGATYSTAPFTSTLWFKARTLPTSTNKAMEIAELGGQTLEAFTNSSGSFISFNGLPVFYHISTSVWYFIGLVLTATQQTIYLNNTDSTLQNNTQSGTYTYTGNWIYGENTGSLYYCNCNLDDLYLFRGAFSELNIYAFFNSVPYPLEIQLEALSAPITYVNSVALATVSITYVTATNAGAKNSLTLTYATSAQTTTITVVKAP